MALFIYVCSTRCLVQSTFCPCPHSIDLKTTYTVCEVPEIDQTLVHSKQAWHSSSSTITELLYSESWTKVKGSFQLSLFVNFMWLLD